MNAPALADLLWRHYKDGTAVAALPDALKPATRAEGYAAQAGLEARSTGPRIGWKIAATSAAGQAHIGVDGPLAGRLLREAIHAEGADISLNGNRMRVAEPEFAFRLGQAVPARAEPYTVEQVMAMVSDLHLAIELPNARLSAFVMAGGAALIADNACAGDFVIGAAVTANWRSIDLSAHPVHCTVQGRYEREGTGANVLGDPRAALTWCVNEVSAQGIEIAAGELVSTGTCAVPLEIVPGDKVEMDFGVLGTIAVQVHET